MNFKPGDKVVCVRGGTKPGFNCPNGPVVKGDVYCVKGPAPIGDAGVLIVGKPTCPDYFGNEDTGWISDRFRLVSEVKLIMEAVRKNAIGKEVETHTVAKP